MRRLEGAHLLGRRGGIDERRLALMAVHESGERFRRDSAFHHRLDLDLQDRMLLPVHLDLLERGPGAGAGENRFRPVYALECAALARGEALADEVARQAERDAGAAGEKRRLGAGVADRQEVVVRDGIDDDEPLGAIGGGFESRTQRRAALPHHRPGHEPYRLFALAPQPATKVRIGHRIERMVLEAGLVEKTVADKEVALIDRAPGGREGRAGDSAAYIEGLRQRLPDWTDIAFRRRVEGRAILEHELPAALRPQPLESLHRERDRVNGGDRAALQRDDAGLASLRSRLRRHPEELHGRQAALRERVRDVARAGEVVGDHAEQHQLSPTGHVQNSGPSRSRKRFSTMRWTSSAPSTRRAWRA